jgi:TPR repeat protein
MRKEMPLMNPAEIGAVALVFAAAIFTLDPALYSQRLPSDAAFAQQLSFAESGNLSAQLSVAKSYYDGAAGVLSFKQAFDWFQKAADQGSQEAKSWLGFMTLFGRGTPVDVDKALQLLNEGANAGDPWALTFLGIISEGGTRELGPKYQSGTSVPKDISKSVEYYKRAIDLGGGMAAQSLGCLYMAGHGVPKDEAMALRYFARSAELGDDWGEFRLGQMYAHGAQVKQDMDRAVQLYTASAQHGNKLAEMELGQFYQSGTFVPQDLHLAKTYYSRAAIQGYPPAEIALANLLWPGGGPSAHSIDAYVWMSLAASHSKSAAAPLAAMRRQMTEPDLQQAESYIANPDAFFRQYASN